MQIDSATLEKVASIAIYETNNELKKQAEIEFQNFLFQLPLDSYQWLLENHTTTVLLATAAKLAHNLNKIENIPLHLDKINSIFRNWFTKDGRFAYCVNTFGFFIGKSLKEILRGDNTNSMVIEWLTMPAQGDKYRLYIFLVLMEALEVAEPGMTFIDYKSLLNTFQNHYIPRVFSYLYPYFINFSDDIDLAGLTLMQDRLTLANTQPTHPPDMQNRPFSNFTLYVFKLLSQIVNFRFDVNHKEFDQNSENMQIISFPNTIVKQIIKKDFLNALYSIINRLLQINDEKYFLLCLECLQKILAVKLTYIDLQLKKKFISINLKGVVQILNTVFAQNTSNVNIWMKVISCSNKFMLIFRQCSRQDLGVLDKEAETLFVDWVNIIFQFPCMLMNSGQPINSENLLFVASVEAMQLLANELWSHKIDKNLKDMQLKYETFVDCFFKCFILANANILGEVSFQSLEQFKKISLQFLENVALTSTSCYESLFRNMKDCLLIFAQNLQANELNLQNLLLFLSSMVSSQFFFEQNWCGQNLFQIKDNLFLFESTLTYLTELLQAVFEFISVYNELNYNSKPINRAIIIFQETFLTRLLNKTTCSNNAQDVEGSPNDLTITDNLFALLKRRTGIPDQELILNLLRGLSSFIKESQLTSIEFIFASLYRLIAKVKHLYTRERFKHTPIYTEMLALFMRLIKQNLSKDLMKWRVLLFKSISLLSFDDVLDDYRLNIRTTVQLLKQSTDGYYEKVLYDLTGICDGIESELVFEYFITKFMVQNNYELLLGKLFEQLGRNQTYLKDILHLTYLFIQGKYSKNSKITTFNYQILVANLPFWNLLLEKLGQCEEKTQIFEQFYRIYKAVLVHGHINLCIVDNIAPANLRSFLKLSIDHLAFFMDHVENYPDTISPYYQTIQIFFSQLKNVIFNHDDPSLTIAFSNLIDKVMLKFLGNLDNVINDTFHTVIFNAQLNILKQFYEFLQQSKHIIHRSMYTAHLPGLLSLNDQKQQLLVAFILIGMHLGNKKGHSPTLTTICHMICNIIQCYQPNPLAIEVQVGIKDQKDKQQFLRIFDNIVRNLQDWAYIQLQDWFKLNIRFLTKLRSENEDDDGY